MNNRTSLLSSISNDRQKIKLGLENIRLFLNYLGNPQYTFKSILIGGTNGKGSVTYYLSSLASRLTNLKIGRYTSPHLVSINERFVINEKIIDEENLNNVFKEIKDKLVLFEKQSINSIKLTEFEIYTAAAFYLFAKEKIDLAFLEVGMGGRLDATNVVSPENALCSIITNISLDHINYLGDTVEKIAFEKAGIIKENNYVITAAQDKAFQVINNISAKLNSQVLHVENNENDFYQDKNIKLATSAWRIISKQIKTKETNLNIVKYLGSLKFPGRFHFFKDKKILLDGAHNPSAARELKKLLVKHFTNKKIVFIIGILDKSYEDFLGNLLTKDDIVIFTEPKSERATKKELLGQCTTEIGSLCSLAPDLTSAINEAKKINHDIIVITGSLYLVGEALDILK